MQQYGLGLHTTSPQLGLCLNNFAGDLRSQTWDLDREISTHLHQYLQEFLKPQTWQDLQFIAVAKGPGSFTGTRIGIVTARTLAQQLDIPVWGISTLAGIVWSQKANYIPNTPIPVAMEARRGQLFVAIYQIGTDKMSLNSYLSDTTMTIQTWEETLQELSSPYPPIKVPLEVGKTVDSILELAYLQWQQGKKSHWSEVLPFYGQHPVN